ncbi:ABC transporter permease [Corynebacterium guangdongense]|uniref:Iron(III) transport system permease protein n=1 Tax=Corynebacterium guangdongense TaxID=1783348 RepID=A0ABU1ZY65_9CORY|nr:iron ABC transporter permease [Corynebacterium guangdongense]MDR7329866.1 iron(III) transport system permease protein [Corynebacterium guangdongense]WJZ18429.1 Inner membrane ABC transporter permease protein YcjO [Corynebacterium guangdongense]
MKTLLTLRLATWLIIAGLILTPLGLVVGLAFGGNQLPVLDDLNVATAAWNSAWTTLVSAAGAVVAGTAVALLVDRTDVHGRGLLRLFLLSPLLIPPFVGAIAWLQLFSPRQGLNALAGTEVWNIYGGDGVAFLLTVHTYPVVYVIVANALRAIPSDLEQAARVAGASTGEVIRTITLPLLRPALLSAFTLSAVSNLADFGIPSLIGSPAGFETLATMIYRVMDSSLVANPLQVVSTIGIVLLLLGVAAVVLDHVVSLRASTSLQDTGAATQFPLGRSRRAVSVAAWLAALALTLSPVLGLLYRALLPAPGVPFTLANISLDNFVQSLQNPRTVDGFTNSLLLATGAALICGVLGWLVGVLVTRVNWPVNAAMTLTVLLPTAVPGMIIGVGWLILGRYTGIYNTRWVILGAYVCAFTALVLQSVRAPLTQTPLAVEEAARAAGAGRARAIFQTTGLMAVPAAVSGAVLVAVTAIRELTVSILLIAPGTTTLGVQLFNLQSAGDYNQASALSLMFALIGIIALALTVRGPAGGTARARSQARARTRFRTRSRKERP